MITRSLALGAVGAAMVAVGGLSSAQAGAVVVRAGPPGPVYYVAPYATPVGVRTTYVAGPRCAWRVTRIWTGYGYASRRVRTCW